MAVDNLTSWRDGVTAEQMREIDRLADERYGISSFVLMEVAGLAVARVARDLLRPPISERAIVILAGPGNNGGDGLVAARRLFGWGAEVSVFTSYPLDHAKDLSARQITVATGAGVSVEAWEVDEEEDDFDGPGEIEEIEADDQVSADASDLQTYDLIIDALLGFGVRGDPRPPVSGMIEAANESGTQILAVDLPSGLDATSGQPQEPCIEARATATLALPKTGLLADDASSHVGQLYLADIGVPLPLLLDLGVDPDGLFAEDDIMRLT
jgi:hydroxyethylthiazole kinase-like uncharacterized protein yjeF